MKKWIEEFKAFAVRGNVMDMAIGVIIGGAFGKIVSSLVADVVMPPIGRLMGGVDFSGLFISLNGISYATLKDAQTAGAPTLNYGVFINTVVNFLIVAFTVFLMIKGMNVLQAKEKAKELEKQKAAPPPPPSKEEALLAEIRDILKSK